MMRILILGGAGMLGHRLWQECRERFDTWITLRRPYSEYAGHGIFARERVKEHVSACDFQTVERVLRELRPEVVVNCIGIIKQLPEASDPLVAIPVNALFPHRLAGACQASAARLIHISTDCVFSGRHGMRTELDIPDPTDLYGRSKCLGEVTGPGCLTLRTSMIGRELGSNRGLVEWFLGQRHRTVKGYTHAVFSGLTTGVLSHLIAETIARGVPFEGLYHAASTPVTKYDLLCQIRSALGLDVDVVPDSGVVIDRSLDGSRFARLTGFQAPSWAEMIQDLAAASVAYSDA